MEPSAENGTGPADRSSAAKQEPPWKRSQVERHLRAFDPSQQLAAETDPEDGIDPRERFRNESYREGRSQKKDIKLLRLAHQVKETLLTAIPFAGVPQLAGFVVDDVLPNRTGSTMTVRLHCTDPNYAYDPRQIKAALDKIKGSLRAEVAAAITRRYTPDLRFEVKPYE